MKPQAILCDIEGTTTSLSFVQSILFPLSHREMERFIREHWTNDLIRTELENLKTTIASSRHDEAANVGPVDVVQTLRQWIDADVKETNLKSIQGKIWKEAFESGQIRGHVYPDVHISFKKWKKQGIIIAIFSSGSVEAQKLLFRYSEAGDLTGFISHYFDTQTGAKREPESYRKIAEAIGLQPPGILFLSDTVEELDAARLAGMATIQLLREGSTPPSHTHPIVTKFSEINVD